MRAQRVITEILSLVAFLLIPQCLGAQGTLEDYRRAATIMDRIEGLAVGVAEPPTWIGDTHRFWYRVSMEGGHEFVVVDAGTREKDPAFDHSRLAAALSSAAGEDYTAITLPFRTFEYLDDEGAVEADAGESRFRCSLQDYSCTRIGEAEGGRPVWERPRRGGQEFGDAADTITAIVSPDSTKEAFIQNFNIAIRPRRHPGAGVHLAEP